VREARENLQSTERRTLGSASIIVAERVRKGVGGVRYRLFVVAFCCRRAFATGCEVLDSLRPLRENLANKHSE
jgi:hypothetical protein